MNVSPFVAKSRFLQKILRLCPENIRSAYHNTYQQYKNKNPNSMVGGFCLGRTGDTI